MGWLKYQTAFNASPYQFQVFELWREAIKLATPFWLRLLLADIILIVVMHLPFWMPLLGKWFPFLEALRIHPAIFNTPGFFANFATLSKLLLPFLFGLFVIVPVYLGVNLLAFRIVYQRPAPITILSHYLSLFWWSNIVTLFFLSGIILVPCIYALQFLFAHASTPGFIAQFYLGLLATLFFFGYIVVMLSLVIGLVFAARVAPIDAIKMSWKAVKQNFWKIFAMLILLYMVRSIGYRTWYASDLLLMPPSAIAWALMYKKIFSAHGLVE